jgi:ATP-dependent exoDNAse (exonuclease V) beta subunit
LNEPIRFDPSDHSYWAGDARLDSVTQVVKLLTPEFDSERVAAKVAKRDRLTVPEVLAQWKAKSDAGKAKGSRVHAYIESRLDGTADPVTDLVNEREPEMDAFDAAWASLTGKVAAEVVSKEAIVGDVGLGVAGRVDLVISMRVQGVTSRNVFDWKTGGYETANRYEKLLAPFGDLQNCEHSRYSLQLSLYRLLLERTTKTQYGDSYIVHLGSDGEYCAHKATDLRGRLEMWLLKRKHRA